MLLPAVLLTVLAARLIDPLVAVAGLAAGGLLQPLWARLAAALAIALAVELIDPDGGAPLFWPVLLPAAAAAGIWIAAGAFLRRFLYALR
jgi:hypothetical protein